MLNRLPCIYDATMSIISNMEELLSFNALSTKFVIALYQMELWNLQLGKEDLKALVTMFQKHKVSKNSVLTFKKNVEKS